ncbi:MAG: DUF4279 domain-containing protein [Nitrospirota bacterium]
MDNYSVEFRICSEKDDFDLDAITKNLEVTPNNTRQRGERKSASRVHEESMWGYSIETENGPVAWDSLEEGLESLLKVFMPLKEKIKEYALKYDVVLWCGFFKDSFDDGPRFSPEILKKLADFGVEIYLSVYCSTLNPE